uniref:Uncharacterized protein n=1 Tax=Parascaris equorum TaxID=6256 RepID=A0A914RVJ4_PAREQ
MASFKLGPTGCSDLSLNKCNRFHRKIPTHLLERCLTEGPTLLEFPGWFNGNFALRKIFYPSKTSLA